VFKCLNCVFEAKSRGKELRKAESPSLECLFWPEEPDNIYLFKIELGKNCCTM
jgi:hypothetical protein